MSTFGSLEMPPESFQMTLGSLIRLLKYVMQSWIHSTRDLDRQKRSRNAESLHRNMLEVWLILQKFTMGKKRFLLLVSVIVILIHAGCGLGPKRSVKLPD